MCEFDSKFMALIKELGRSSATTLHLTATPQDHTKLIWGQNLQ